MANRPEAARGTDVVSRAAGGPSYEPQVALLRAARPLTWSNVPAPIRSEPVRTVPQEYGSPITPWIHDASLVPAESAELVRAYRFVGRLDERAIDRGLQQIVARHAILRTVFRARDGHAAGTVLRSAVLVMPVVQIERMAIAQRERDLRGLIAESIGAPFDLSHPPLLRAELFQTGPRERVLLLRVHRVVADLAPVSRLARELEELYAASVEH
jgi:hypothetical protein